MPALLALTGCSIALDFDRTFPTQGDFPGGYLKAPKAGEAALEGTQLEVGCLTFCKSYVACLAQPDICHYISALPDGDVASACTGGQEFLGKQVLINRCAEDCETAATLTPTQLMSIQNAAECREVARAVVAPDQAACNPLKDECTAYCNPPAGSASLADCEKLPGLRDGNCQRLCENQSVLFFGCINCQPPEQSLCASAETCAMEYYRPLGLDGSTRSAN
jgi:hypothetical protein